MDHHSTSSNESLSYEAKYIHVKEWLDKLYCGTEIPAIEDGVVEELYSLSIQSEESERCAAIFMREMEQRIQQYKEETGQLQSVHEMVGVTLEDLHADTVDQIELVTKTANILQCSDATTTSIFFGLSQLQMDLSATKCESLRLSRQLLKLDKQISEAQAEKERLLNFSEVIEQKTKSVKHDVPHTKSQTVFLRQKSEQYQQHITALEEQLNKNNFVPGIKHSELVSIYQEIKGLEGKLSPLKKKLRHYSELPPNLELAQLKILELKSELLKLERQISKDIDLIDAEK